MAKKRKKPIIVEVSGGNVQGVWNLPSGYDWQLLDWDNLLPDTYTTGDTARKRKPSARQTVLSPRSTPHKRPG